MFHMLLAAAEKGLEVLEKADRGYPHTQLVIGEMHYYPKVQCDLLTALVTIAQTLPIGLIGTEGNPQHLSSLFWVDTGRAMSEEEYMRKLLIRDIRVVRIFGKMFPEVRVEDTENADLRKVARLIDHKCHELHQLTQEKGGLEHLSLAQKEECDYWFSLLKKIVLGDRSSWMVKNLYAEQTRLSIPKAILLCGASHTPLREEHRPYSVVGALQALPLNYIVAVVPSAVRPLHEKDAFDFWSRSDPSELRPYDNLTGQE